MAYDDLAESIALIEAGRPEPVSRLTRRRRFAAMAVDVAGDVAVTMFARHGVGCVWKDIHVLAWRGGAWTWCGGSASDEDDGLLAERPACLPDYGPGGVVGSDPRVMAVLGIGGVLDEGGSPHRTKPSGRWISHAKLRVTAQVTAVQADDRMLDVPWHGHLVVVWSAPTGPRVVALDEGGTPLAETQLVATSRFH